MKIILIFKHYLVIHENNNNIQVLFGNTIDYLAVFDQMDNILASKYIGHN